MHGRGLNVARVLAKMSHRKIPDILPLTSTLSSSTEDTNTCVDRSGHRKRNCKETECYVQLIGLLSPY